MTFAQYYARTAARLSDEALRTELRCARQSAMQCTRARRDLALLRLRCLDCELARRSALSTPAEPSTVPYNDLVRPFSAPS